MRHRQIKLLQAYYLSNQIQIIYLNKFNLYLNYYSFEYYRMLFAQSRISFMLKVEFQILFVNNQSLKEQIFSPFQVSSLVDIIYFQLLQLSFWDHITSLPN